ncbi:MAG: type II toxin-antitoxin system HicA family toxin [Nitrospirota bacterium]
MPKIPRDISGEELAKSLSKAGYEITRQTGSHMRLSCRLNDAEHHITIPAHSPLKIGTLNNILKDVAEFLKIDKKTLLEQLF